MPWLQLRITAARADAEKVERAMLQCGAMAVTFEDNADDPIFEPGLGETPLWQETRITGLFDAAIDTNSVLADVTNIVKAAVGRSQWHILEDKDWQREWMKHFSPIMISEKFWICPTSHTPLPEAVNLMIDPGLAFGTGTHATTFLCLQWLESSVTADTDVIDYGCGSGILGIAALLLGAKHVTGIDIDPQALHATRENMQRNKLASQRFDVFFPENATQRPADIVLANILAGPLVELKRTLIALLKPEAKLCLSGILASQTDAIAAAYEDSVVIESVTEQEGWACIAATKTVANIGA